MQSDLIQSGGLPNATLDPSPKTQDPSAPLDLIAEGNMSVADIAQASGISILELARIVTTPDNLKQLQQVSQLHATQREILLGQLKRNALLRLAELTDEVPAASADEIRAAEVMRKACVDLLRYGGSAINSSTSRNPPGHDNTPAPMNEEKILEALVRWDERMDGEINKRGTDSDRRESSVGPGSLAGWSKAKPQAMSGGRDVVREVERTHDVQVGMAFGKTSDHGAGPIRSMNSGPNSDGLDTRTGETPVPPLEEAICRGCHGQVPPARDDCGLGNLSQSPHGQTAKTPLAHATRNPPQQPRPPPARSPPSLPP